MSADEFGFCHFDQLNVTCAYTELSTSSAALFIYTKLQNFELKRRQIKFMEYLCTTFFMNLHDTRSCVHTFHIHDMVTDVLIEIFVLRAVKI